MPTIGAFHDKYWRARAQTPPPPGTGSSPPMYPVWQASVIGMGAPYEVLEAVWAQVCWLWRLARLLWWYRDPVAQREMEAMITQRCAGQASPRAAESPSATAVTEEPPILGRVRDLLQHPYWDDTMARVRACATTPKFHHSDQWVAYGRALRGNSGQAQNTFRHLRVVQELRAAHPELSNPDAHFLTELAYQVMAETPTRHVQIVDHPKRLIDHVKQRVTH